MSLTFGRHAARLGTLKPGRVKFAWTGDGQYVSLGLVEDQVFNIAEAKMHLSGGAR